MKKPTIFLLMFFAFITILSAQNRGTFASVQNGAWTDPDTWGGTTTPSVGDKVTISDTVQLDTSITGGGLKELTVTSTGSLIQDADQTAGLIMAQRSALTVDGYMEVNKLEIKHGFFGSETITVNGTLIIHGDFKRGGSFRNPTPVTGDGTVSAEIIQIRVLGVITLFLVYHRVILKMANPMVAQHGKGEPFLEER